MTPGQRRMVAINSLCLVGVVIVFIVAIIAATIRDGIHLPF